MRGSNGKLGIAMWNCRCTCAKQTLRQVRDSNLKNGSSRSCGCLGIAARAAANSITKRKHGAAIKGQLTPEYQAWRKMKARCTNPNNKDYPRYGGRGIKVFEGWLNDFQAFYDHIGDKPSKEHSIDRIDNDKHYEPGNVRWATPVEQANNTEKTLMISHQGVTKSLTDWARVTGIRKTTIWNRLNKLGWSAERSLTCQTR